ncbi:MAG TPA: ABC transporter permease [Blastocatellia bacterium]|nr:ABC transporter permease [Blastocatellia bacterium]
MSALRQFFARLRALFFRNRWEQDLADEIKIHVDMLTRENISRGMNETEARYAARREFGGIQQIAEAYRDQKSLTIVESLVQDVRYGLRLLRKNPGFSTVAILTLALGIGANTAIFSVLNGVMLESLPVSHPQQLLLLGWRAPEWPDVIESIEGNSLTDPGGGLTGDSYSWQMYDALRDKNTVFSDTIAFSSNLQSFNLQYRGVSDTATAEPVSGNYFQGLAVQPILGRPILPDDDVKGAPGVAVVSYAFWKGKLGGNESIVDETIVVNSLPVTVVGIAPPEFFGTQPGNSIDIWVPLNSYPQLLRGLAYLAPGQVNLEAAQQAYLADPRTWWLVVIGRLKPGITESAARAELQVLFDQGIEPLVTSEAQARTKPSMKVLPGAQGMDELRRRYSQPLAVLMCGVGLVLLIACANVAGLLLARAGARQREIALRLGLGARRIRLVQQLLTESVLLSLGGGVFGLLLSLWLSRFLVAIVDNGRINLPLNVDSRVLAFTAVVSLLTGVLFGLAPAMASTKISLSEALKEGGAGKHTGGRSRTVKVLVCGQVALSLLLLIGAGLFSRTLQKLQGVSLGFDRERLLLFSVWPGLNGYRGDRLVNYYTDVQSRIAALPGVRSVSFSGHGPIAYGSNVSFCSVPQMEKTRVLRTNGIGPGYFETLGIPLFAGRFINQHDDESGPKVAVINRALAAEVFGDTDPLGKILRFGTEKRPRDFEIVGIVGDAKYEDLRSGPPLTVYFSYQQTLGGASFMTFEVRATGDTDSITALVRSEVAGVDASVPVQRMETLDNAIDRKLMLERMFSRLIGFFGMLALVLVCVGLYGTMSYFVGRKTNEIGIRMALGAQPARVFRGVLLEGATLTGIGIVVGFASAIGVTRLIASLLYEVAALDVLSFTLGALVLLVVGLLACYIPARRAMRVDPIVALRCE